MDDIIQYLETRLRRSEACDADVVANLSKALEALERARLVRQIRDCGLSINWGSLPDKTIKVKKKRGY